jgi:hypothetical protein
MKHHPNTFLELAQRAEPLVRANLSADPKRTTKELLGRDGKWLRFKSPGQIKRTYEQQESRFWALVSISDDPDACWPYFSIDESKGGYGSAYFFGRKMIASRLALCFVHREPYDNPDWDACHSCDNPPCCNPNHLFKGTSKENIQDSMRKGRFRIMRGEDHGNSKFSEALVREIIAQYQASSKRGVCCALAKRYSVSYSSIWRLVTGRSWTHLQG